MRNPLCLYHKDCSDGFTAAWAVWKRFPDWEFLPVAYNEPPPDVTGRDVVIVDFSYKRAVLLELGEKAESILILDHHETAEKELADFPPPVLLNYWEDWVGSLLDLRRSMPDLRPVVALFDMERSGAMMAWQFFHDTSAEDIPGIVRYAQDRDLWQWRLEDSHQVNAYIGAAPKTWAKWDWIQDHIGDDYGRGRGELVHGGAAILMADDVRRELWIRQTRRTMMIGGYHDVPVANVPQSMASEVAHELAKGASAGFAATYMDTHEGRVFSLRAGTDGPNVAEIAAKYGGGGHAKAAGFTVELGWEGDSNA